MAIYVFNLLTGYGPNGIDNAQGYRAKMLKNMSCSVKYVFTELPTREEINYYNKIGINEEQMISAHQYFLEYSALNPSVKAEEKLEELRVRLNCTEIERKEKGIRLKRQGMIVAELLLDDNDRNYIHAIYYFNNGKLLRAEIYTDRIFYANYYITAESEHGLYAKLKRRTFYNKDGSVAYNQIFEKEREYYLFEDGKMCTKAQFMKEFTVKLNLTEKDTVIVDRTAQFDFVQPLFQCGNKARFIVVVHSEHYFEKGRDFNWSYRYFNWEYLYWFKYLKMIDTIVVSTQEQKDNLLQLLHKYYTDIPCIEVIPAGGIEYLQYPEGARRSCSLVSVSRLSPRKKVDWLIKGVLKAHEINPDITFDIYGDGSCRSALEKIVEEGQAQSYIRFMGYGDVTNVYRNYEVFVTASICETLGLSTMEAIGSGAAVIGLDVAYGNRLFVRPERNGYLISLSAVSSRPVTNDQNEKWINTAPLVTDKSIDYDVNDIDEEKLTDVMGEKIVEIFRDDQRLEKFHQISYEIASEFLNSVIEEKWKKLLM